jgi:hypothetical protein
MMSPDSSGGHLSSVVRTASTMALTGLLDRPSDLLGRHDDRLGQPGDQVAPADLGLRLVRRGEGRADRHLDLLGGALAEHQRVLLLHPGDDRGVELVAAGADRLAGDDAAERDDGDLGGAAADVDDHAADRVGDRQPGADRRRHRLLDDVHLPRAGLVAGVLDGAPLDAGDARRHADDQPRLGEVRRVCTFWMK